MPRVLVVGGTGLAGRSVTAEAIERGHEVVVASRRVPDGDAPGTVLGADYRFADLVTGDGLEEVLDGVDVIVDVSNGGGRAASHVFASGSQNLLHTAARFGVHQAVLLSIVNVDRSAYPYYRAKAAQERNFQESPLETRIVRATQFHDFVTDIFQRGSRMGIIPSPSRTSFQPIAVSDVARILVDAAGGSGEPNSTRTIGGPEVRTSRDLAQEWKSARGARGVIVGTRIGGPLGATWRAGDNLVPDDAIDGVGYREWLTATAA